MYNLETHESSVYIKEKFYEEENYWNTHQAIIDAILDTIY